MTRQVFVRVLMSLLLLFSQQIATSHVLTHWTGSVATAALVQPLSDADIVHADNVDADKGDPDNLRTAAKDQSCNKCLMLAQFGAPLVSSVLSYAAPQLPSLPVDGAAIAAAHARTILAFQSRAPPQA